MAEKNFLREMLKGKNQEEYNKVVHMLRNKYYNLYRSNFEWKGLSYRQEEFIMKEFWAKGTVAAFKIKHLDELGFADWTMQSFDMYGLPEKVNLVNTYSSPLIPSDTQIVDKDVVLGYIQANHKPLKMIVDWYIERMAQVQMVINTNLQLHKLPYIIPVEPENKKVMEDIVQRILNDELVLFVDGVDPNLFKAVATGAPYIIDKLQNYYKDLENDLKTVMGINNNGVNKIEQLQLSEVSANDSEIQAHDDDFEKCLKSFCNQIKEVLNITVGVNVKENEFKESNPKEYDEAPGPKENNEDD